MKEVRTSALGQSLPFDDVCGMSALPQIADMMTERLDFGFGPAPDSFTAA